MTTSRRSIALTELILIAPAALFMSSLFLRQVQPALRTGRVVEWFGQHFVLGLIVFLVLMPLAALLAGCIVMLRSWRGDLEFRRATAQFLSSAREHLASLIIAGAVLMAAGVLFIVGLHLITE